MEQFIQLKTNSNIRLPLLQYAKNSSTTWFHKNAFDIAKVPIYLIDKTLQDFKSKFDASPVIFRMQPWQFYRFHTDASRSCAINFLLEGTDSHTYYGTETENEEILNIRELKYKIDSYYLINTQLKHSVVNRDNVRYMFSMGFPSTTSYDDVRNYCLENQL
jgi:hypothetical protein